MNVIKANTYTFFLGFLEDDEFWSVSQFDDQDKAQDAFEHYRMAYPKHIVQLIQEIKMHKVLETHYPIGQTLRHD